MKVFEELFGGQKSAHDLLQAAVLFIVISKMFSNTL